MDDKEVEEFIGLAKHHRYAAAGGIAIGVVSSRLTCWIVQCDPPPFDLEIAEEWIGGTAALAAFFVYLSIYGNWILGLKDWRWKDTYRYYFSDRAKKLKYDITPKQAESRDIYGKLKREVLKKEYQQAIPHADVRAGVAHAFYFATILNLVFGVVILPLRIWSPGDSLRAGISSVVLSVLLFCCGLLFDRGLEKEETAFFREHEEQVDQVIKCACETWKLKVTDDTRSS